MNTCPSDFNQLWNEYIALCRHLGDIQRRCSNLVSDLQTQVKQLEAQTMQLRAVLIVQATTRQVEQESLAQLITTNDALPAPATELVSASTVDSDELDASLAAADLVICQIGCFSRGAFWRVQDHCKRTGKSCVLVEQPDAVRIVRIHQMADKM